MKKALYVAIAVVFALGAMASLSFAGPNVGNDNQQGSLIVFGKVVVKGMVNQDGTFASVTDDTLLHIVNNYRGTLSDPGDVQLECYWMNELQENGSFSIYLTHTDPYDMWASDRIKGRAEPAATTYPAPGVAYGEVKCWAVDYSFNNQIKFNYLFGTATIFDFANGYAEQYSSYNFRAIPGANRAAVGTAGTLKLDGVEYDGCPARVMGAFIPPTAKVTDFGAVVVEAATTDLTLVPCTQSLGQDTVPVPVKAEMLFWDYDEVRMDTVYVCFKCWMETTLTSVPVSSKGVTKIVGFEIFNRFDGDVAYFEARGVAGNGACPSAVDAIPFFGVLRTQAMVGGKVTTFATGLNQTSTLWTGKAPTISWGNETDPDPNPEMSGR